MARNEHESGNSGNGAFLDGIQVVADNVQLSRKRIKLLFLNYNLNTGGIETLIVEMLNGLPRKQFDASVAVFEGGGALEAAVYEGGFQLHDLQKREGFDPGLVFRLRQLLKRERINIVHTHNFSAWLYAVLATFAMPGVKIVHTEHSLVKGNKRRRFLAEKFCARYTRHIVAVSEDVKGKMVDLCGIPSARIFVVTNGIDTGKFKSSPDLRATARAGLGLDGNEFLIGTVGRLVKVKDHATMIQAFTRLYEIDNQTRLLIVGDGLELKALTREIEQADLVGKVILAGDRRDVPALLSALDLYAVSSLSEGFSISILEAMSCGLALVATAVGGNSEILDHRVNGLLVSPADPMQLFQAMLELRRDNRLRHDMGKRNREKITREFSMQSMLDRYLQFYFS